MKISPSIGLLVLTAFAGAGVFAGVGCSSSSSSPSAPLDSGTTTPDSSATAPTQESDGGPPVGAACAADTDCPTQEKCSNDVYSGGNPIYPTPICLAGCVPSTNPSDGLAPCGPSTLPGAGLCQPPPSTSSSTAGLCLPFCVVTPTGQVTGCLANDACQLLGAIDDPTDATQVDGAGWCQPGCTENSQCPTGSICDPLEAACAKTALTATLPLGAICSLTVAETQCNCVGANGQTTGYCTAACVTGLTECPSPSADGGTSPASDGGQGDAGASSPTPWVCSAQTNVTATYVDGGAIFTTQPQGLFGFCTPSCRTDADCAGIQGHCSQGDPAAPTGYTGTCAAGP